MKLKPSATKRMALPSLPKRTAPSPPKASVSSTKGTAPIALALMLLMFGRSSSDPQKKGLSAGQYKGSSEDNSYAMTCCMGREGNLFRSLT